MKLIRTGLALAALAAIVTSAFAQDKPKPKPTAPSKPMHKKMHHLKKPVATNVSKPAAAGAPKTVKPAPTSPVAAASGPKPVKPSPVSPIAAAKGPQKPVKPVDPASKTKTGG